jgi:hypothetical protein
VTNLTSDINACTSANATLESEKSDLEAQIEVHISTAAELNA